MATMTMYPSQTAPGSAARQAAAAANLDRQQREQELLYAQRFISGQYPTSTRDNELKDDESGVGMEFVSGIVRADSVTDKKMSKCFSPLSLLFGMTFPRSMGHDCTTDCSCHGLSAIAYLAF